MNWLAQVGNWAHGHNLAGIVFVHSQAVLPLLALTGLLLIKDRELRYANRYLVVANFFVMILTYGAWQLDISTPLLLAAALIFGLAVWSVFDMIRSIRLSASTDDPRFAKLAWLTFLAAVLIISLASVLDLTEVYFFGDYLKPQPGLAGLLDMSLFALRGLTWDVASIAFIVMVVFFGLHLAFQRPDGKSVTHQQLEAY